MHDASADPLARVLERIEEALAHPTPADVAAALGHPDDGATRPDARLILVEPDGAGALWLLAQVSVGRDGAVGAIVIDFEPRQGPTMASAIAQFGQPARYPTSRGQEWSWTPDRTGIKAAIAAETDASGERISRLGFAPERGAPLV